MGLCLYLCFHACLILPCLYTFGGLDKNGKTLSDAWLLDINTGMWRKVRELEGCDVCVAKPCKYHSNRKWYYNNASIQIEP